MHVRVAQYTKTLLIFPGTFGVVRTYLTRIHTYHARTHFFGVGRAPVRRACASFLFEIIVKVHATEYPERSEYGDSVTGENRA